MRVNVNESKLLGLAVKSVSLNGKNLEEVDCFRYLGVGVAANGTTGAEVSDRVGGTAKVLGVLRSV